MDIETLNAKLIELQAEYAGKVKALAETKQSKGSLETVADQVGRLTVEVMRISDSLRIVKEEVQKMIEHEGRERASQNNESERTDEPQIQDSNSKAAMLRAIVAAKKLPVTVRDDGRLIIRHSFSIGSTAAINPSGQKSIGSTDRAGSAGFVPTDTQLAKINKYAKVPFTKDNVISVPWVASNTVVDRGFEQFNKTALMSMMKLYPNKPFLIDHDWSVRSLVGKNYDAELNGDTLIVHAYIPTRLKDIVAMVQEGLLDKVSVGFAMDPEHYICNACGDCMMSNKCPHMPGMPDEKGKTVTVTLADVIDVMELSGVVVPMNQTAELPNDGKSLKSLAPERIEMSNGYLEKLAEAQANAKNADAIAALANESHTPDTMSIDMTTTEDSLMPDEKEKAVDAASEAVENEVDAKAKEADKEEKDENEADSAEVKPADAENAEVKPADEKSADELKAAFEKATADAEAAKKAYEAAIVAAKAAPEPKTADVKVDASELKAVAASVTKTLDEFSKAQATANGELSKQLSTLNERIESLEKLVKVASDTSVDSLKELVNGSNEVETKTKHWIQEYFGADLGGQ